MAQLLVLNKSGAEFYKNLMISGFEPEQITDPELMGLYQFLLENNFISKDDYVEESKDIVSAYVHLTNKCNLHCVGCYSWDTKRNSEPDLSFEVLCKAIKGLAEEGLVNLVFSGGEPLYRKDIVELVKFAKVDCNIEKVILITNGTVCRPEVFEQLQEYVDAVSVSLDTYSTECPAYIRDEGIHDRVVETVLALKKRNIPVSILPTLHKLNAEFMIKYLELSAELKVGISYSILSTCETEEFKRFMLSEEELLSISNHFSTYGLTANDTPINNVLECKAYCGACKNMLSVGTDGKIYPCHMLMVPEFCLGDINDTSIRDLMEKSEVAKQFENFRVDQFSNCKECAYKYLCGGGCRARAFMLKHDIKEKDPYCIMFRNYYDKLTENIKSQITVANAG